MNVSVYEGVKIALATMHGKEQAVAPAVQTILGAEIYVPFNIDTDLFGSFSGEIERKGTMGETAIAKARLGMALTGLPYGMASEGTYGAHPFVPFMPGGLELLVFIDQGRGLTITETLIADAPCFDHVTAKEFGEVELFLKGIDFPTHGVIIKPNRPVDSPSASFKGITNPVELKTTFDACRIGSEDYSVLVQTDMRAQYNPTRMRLISRLAVKLCNRLISLCKLCNSPGFGKSVAAEGLPCSACGTETSLKRGHYLTCEVCSHKEFKAREHGEHYADPKYCPNCNP